jgi:signal recognition particle receptor subunit beta
MRFDPLTGTLSLRILYDGSGLAGKTTNLVRLAEQFPGETEAVMISPDTEDGGRTQFFDWVVLRTGKIDGYPLRCELLTVPGQFVYADRRMHLLQGADVIVCVCDSSEDAIQKMRVGISFQREAMAHLGRDSVPVIVQANKQDLPNALSVREIASILELPESSVVPASTASGEGVRPTLLAALHAGVRMLRARIAAEGVEGLVGDSESPEKLEANMRAIAEADMVAAQNVVDTAVAKVRSVFPDAESQVTARPPSELCVNRPTLEMKAVSGGKPSVAGQRETLEGRPRSPVLALHAIRLPHEYLPFGGARRLMGGTRKDFPLVEDEHPKASSAVEGAIVQPSRAPKATVSTVPVHHAEIRQPTSSKG